MIVLTGASASGKTEVVKLLKIKYGIDKVVTHTTRKIRPLEIPDEDYHFITKQEFQKMISEDKFVEWTIYNGNYYGTSKEEIGINKAIILEPNGVKAMQALNQNTIIVFRLLASEITRFNRMIIRQDPLEKIRERISNDKICFSDDNFTNIDYTIDTDKHTILEVTDEVYSLYIKKLSQLNHKA